MEAKLFHRCSVDFARSIFSNSFVRHDFEARSLPDAHQFVKLLRLQLAYALLNLMKA